jgi:transposase-like protein
MPRKTKTTASADQAAQPQIPSELFDQLLTGPMTAGQVQGLFDQFKKALLERALGAEMSRRLGYAPGQTKPEGVGNQRNGKSAKTALGTVFPATTLQTCIVLLIRNSLDFASWKERKALAAAIKPIYTAVSVEAAQAELDAFEAGPWGQKFPTVVSAWLRAWDKVIPFFAFSPEVRRVIYTTNAIESVSARLRKIIKTRGHFPSDDAATKLIWLALRNITENWGQALHNWKAAMNRFAILYEDRFTKPVQNAAR